MPLGSTGHLHLKALLGNICAVRAILLVRAYSVDNMCMLLCISLGYGSAGIKDLMRHYRIRLTRIVSCRFYFA